MICLQKSEYDLIYIYILVSSVTYTSSPATQQALRWDFAISPGQWPRKSEDTGFRTGSLVDACHNCDMCKFKACLEWVDTS